MASRQAVTTKILAVAVVAVLVVAGAAAYLVVSSSGSTGKSQTASDSTSTSQYTGTQSFTFQAGGSSLVAPLVDVWTYAFGSYSNSKVTTNYQSIGSAAGEQGFFDGSFSFACTVNPISTSQIANFTKGTPNVGNTLLQIPESLTGITIFYNVPGLSNKSIDLTGQVLAGIYNESITKWNDPAIEALNPGLTFPDQTIVPVHRSDGAGATYALTYYLNQVDPSWNSTVGVGLIVNWPSNELGGDGSGAVAQLVAGTPDSIGYADEVYAQDNGLTVANIENSAGNFIAPSDTTILNAANDFSAQIQSNPLFTITDAPGANSYPISSYSYIIVWKNQPSAAQGYALSTFIWWTVNEGQSYGAKLYFPPIPQEVVSIDNAMIAQINYNGQTFSHP